MKTKSIKISILLFFTVILLISCKENAKVNTTKKPKTLPKITVKANQFVNEKGQEIVFRGYNISDPDKLESQGHWQKSYFQEVKNWGANVVRIPVHPPVWKKRGKENYLKLLDQAVEWSTELNMHIIIDWHSIGNLHEEKFFLEIYNTSQEETFDFWKTIAQRYGDNTTVAFYELFNEPTHYNHKLGDITWQDWKGLNEKMIGIIRENGGKGIPLVAGFNWAYDLTPVKENPINAEGIGYVSHPYPQKREQPWQEKWDQDWGFVKDKYPLILSEIGFCHSDDVGAHIPVINDDDTYGDAITNYADAKGISYVAWVFDADWDPKLFNDWKTYEPSRHGNFFKKKISSYKYN